MLYKGLILDPCFSKLFAVSFLRPSFEALPGGLGVLGGEDVDVCAGGVVGLVFSVFSFFALFGEFLGFFFLVGEESSVSEACLRFPR